MNEELDKRYVLRKEFEELKDYSVRTRRMARNISQDLKDLANKIENDIDDDAFELDISKGRFKMGKNDIGSLIVIGLLATVILGVWGLVK